MKRVWISLISIIIMSLVVVGCGNSNGENASENDNSDQEASEKVVLRIGTGYTEEHAHNKALMGTLTEILEEETNGRFEVQVFPNATMGDDREMIERVQMGSLDVAFSGVAVAANFVPEFEIFNLPFLFPSEEVATEVLEGPVGQEILDKAKEKNMIALPFWEQGYFHITNSKHEVKSAEDLKGLKIRAMENQIQLDTLRALGANPTPMSYSELFTALQQGAVDGQQNPIELIYGDKFYEVQKYLTLSPHVYGPTAVLVSEEFYNNLTSEDQELFVNAMDTAREEATKMMRKANTKKLKELKDYGIIVNEFEPEELEKMRDMVQPVINEYSEEIGKDIVDKVYRAVEDASE